jgi:hypothetical protein
LLLHSCAEKFVMSPVPALNVINPPPVQSSADAGEQLNAAPPLPIVPAVPVVPPVPAPVPAAPVVPAVPGLPAAPVRDPCEPPQFAPMAPAKINPAMPRTVEIGRILTTACRMLIVLF